MNASSGRGAHRYRMMYSASLDVTTAFDASKPGIIAEDVEMTTQGDW